MGSGNNFVKCRAPALLLTVLMAACTGTEQDLDAGARQAEADLNNGPPFIVDYYGAPGIKRFDGRLGLMVPGCDAPRGRILAALDSGARTGPEIYAALLDQWAVLGSFTENLIEPGNYWEQGFTPAIVECYAVDSTGEPEVCAWLLLSKDAPKASKAWVLGYNYRVLKWVSANTPCEHVLWDDVEEWIDDL